MKIFVINFFHSSSPSSVLVPGISLHSVELDTLYAHLGCIHCISVFPLYTSNRRTSFCSEICTPVSSHTSAFLSQTNRSSRRLCLAAVRFRIVSNAQNITAFQSGLRRSSSITLSFHFLVFLKLLSRC